jgi:HEAT repeat protein
VQAWADDYRALSTEELISLARGIEQRGRPHGDPDWGAVVALHERGTPEVLAAAQSLCRAADPIERRVGCLILAEFGHDGIRPIGQQDRPYRDEILGTLHALLEGHEDPSVVWAAASAVSWWSDPRSVEWLLALTGHQDASVRYAVADALTRTIPDWTRPDDRVLAALLEFTRDESVHVRYSAVFDLASVIMEERALHDVAEVREALERALDDPDDGVRESAREGLERVQRS